MIDKDPRQCELLFADEKRTYIIKNKTIFCEKHVEFCHKFLSENLPKQELEKVIM